jgi:very-short-patch-repair endonuclease
MATTTPQRIDFAAFWALVRAQYWVIARRQLLHLGFTPAAIRHRIAIGRLHPIHEGVYAVGRRDLADEGRFMAAVLRCGRSSFLSHRSATALWGIEDAHGGPIHISGPPSLAARPNGIAVHRRTGLREHDIVRHKGIPVTSPALTIVDLAAHASSTRLEAAINAADKLDRIDPDSLRRAVDALPRRPGRAQVRKLLDRRTFVLTDSELERNFLPSARRAGLPPPLTQQRLNGFRVDFLWPDLGLVVETDGLRYHRTPSEQAKDRLRDQAHTAAGLTPLRFTHAQIHYERERVESTLRAVAARLRRP